jgi:uncharacterized membrane protein
MDGWLEALTVVTALGCGLSAGVFFAFSSFVMKALARLPAGRGIAAMQSINDVAVTPPFMLALFGPALACVVLIVAGLLALDESYGIWLIAGGALYLCGTVGLTIAYHVPRNDALATVDAGSEQAASHWDRYVADWTRWNHVRAGAALLAAAALTVGL